MGRSITCNFQCTVRLIGCDSFPIYGAMTLKDVKGILLTEIDYQRQKGIKVEGIEIWSQTATGNKYMRDNADYLYMQPSGKVVPRYINALYN